MVLDCPLPQLCLALEARADWARFSSPFFAGTAESGQAGSSPLRPLSSDKVGQCLRNLASAQA
ncbi:hypothetical protein ACTL6U_21170 [Rhodovibrionaceae bacterium A322]